MLLGRSKDHVFYRVMIDATDNIATAVRLFTENVKNLEERKQYAEQIKTLETKGDEYTRLLIQELNQTFVTPMDHEDIFKLAKNLDNVIDGIEACVARFVYFHVTTTTPYLKKFAEIFEKCAAYLQEAFVLLEKRNYKAIHDIAIEIGFLENEADRLMRESISALFKEPIHMVNLIKMKEIYERLEHVTDMFADVMDVMESVVMKYA